MLKKIALLIILLISCLSLSAQTTCKISDDGDTVEVLSAYLDQNKSAVILSLGNDSNMTSANVVVSVKVTYHYLSYTTTDDYTGKAIVRPGQPIELSIPVSLNHPKDARYKASSVEVVSITGSKCK